MQTRVALVLAGLSLVISLLAMSSVGGAVTGKQQAVAPGVAVAYALVRSDDDGGGFIRNTGFSSVRYEGNGHYCLTIKDTSSQAKRIAMVAAEEEETSSTPVDPVALWDSTNDNCNSGEFAVSTVDYDNDSDSNEIAFSIVIV